MSVIIKRPLSVWITQGILFLFGFLFLASLVSTSINFGKVWFNPSHEMSILAWLGFAGIIFIQLAIVVFICITFWSLVKRKQYGRWLGVGCLSLFFLLLLGGQLISPDGPFAYKQYENASQLRAGILTTIILYSLFLALIVTLARSKRVTNFFEAEQVADHTLTNVENPPIAN